MIEVRTKIRKKGGGSGSSGGFGASALAQIADIQASAFTQLTGLRTLLVPVDESGAELSYAEAEKAVALKSKLDFFSERNVSALGMTGEPGEGGGGGLDVEELAQYLAEKGYATQEWVNSRGFLTYHQSLADYLTRSEAAGLYQPKGSYLGTTDAYNHFVRAIYGDESGGNKDMDSLWDSRSFIGSVYSQDNSPYGVNGWYNVIQLAHRNGVSDGPGYVAQIAMGMTVYYDMLFFRTRRDRPWQYALTPNNYASVLDSAYLRLSGGTMANTNLVTNLNADLLDGHHEDAFLRWRANAPWTDGAARTENTLWSQIGIKTYSNAVPDGITGAYGYGEAVTLSADLSRFEFFCSHYSSEETGVGGLYFRSGWDDDKRPWMRLATVDSNVASATRLLNARTLWGQNFDGSGNVSGDLTGVGHIRMNGMINGAISIELSSTTPFIDFHFGYSTSDYTSRIIEDASGRLNINKTIYANFNGNVGIGTPTATAKLHVNGTGVFSGDLTLGSHLQVYNTIYFKQTGAYLENSTADRLSLNWRTNGNWETTPFVFNKSGNMLATGEVQSSGVNAFRSTYGSYGFIIRNDNLNVHFMLTNSGNASGGYNDLRPLYISCASGDVYVGNSALIARHVTGDVEVRRNIVATGNIACLGAVTEASELEDIYQRLARLENEVF